MKEIEENKNKMCPTWHWRKMKQNKQKKKRKGKKKRGDGYEDKWRTGVKLHTSVGRLSEFS
jgi:hypothetical protein